MGFFEKLGRGLAKTRDAIFGSIGELENADRIDEETYEELLEQLILADTGAQVAEELVDQLRERVKRDRLKTGAEALAALKELLVEMLTAERPFDPQGKLFGQKSSRLRTTMKSEIISTEKETVLRRAEKHTQKKDDAPQEIGRAHV